MTQPTIISPAFEPFFADSDNNDKREAIVIYKPKTKPEPTLRGELRELKKRLDFIKASAAVQEKVEKDVFNEYLKTSKKQSTKTPDLEYESLGEGALPVSKFEVTKKSLKAFEEQTDVLAVLPNQQVHLIAPKSVDYNTLGRDELKHKLTWGLRHLDIPKMWKTTKGKDINVAVLDTGVYGEHPALTDRVKEFVVIDPLGREIETASGKSFDYDSHGTHVCGTIAGQKDANGVSIGVAPEANLFVASIHFGSSFLSNVVQGINWAIRKGADIISMSIGLSYYEPYIDLLFQALLERYGIVPVVAIGNERHGSTSCPGNAPNALSVGAVEKMTGNRVEVASFSSGASLIFPGNTPAVVHNPDIVAPGAQVYSCIPPAAVSGGIFNYTYMDGTSMATPHVAGILALLMAAKPATDVSDIIQAVKDTADHPNNDPTLRPDNRWGFGLIQPAKALQELP